MTTIASRLTSTGTLLVNGRIDEVTQSTISTTANTVFAGFFDEVTNAGSTILTIRINKRVIDAVHGFNRNFFIVFALY